MEPGESQTVDAAGAAAIIGVCKQTIYNLISRGELPAAKIGRVWRIRRRDIDAILAGGQ